MARVSGASNSHSAFSDTYAPRMNSIALSREVNRSAEVPNGSSWTNVYKPTRRGGVSSHESSLMRSHPKMADASKMHELLPQNAHYVAIARVSKHSVDFDPPLEMASQLSRLAWRNQPGR